MEKTTKAKYQDPHTSKISSNARAFGLSLNTDLNLNFALLPYFEKKKLGIIFYDFKSRKTLVMKELSRKNNERAYYELRYANPLSSLSIPEDIIDNEFLKRKSLQSLKLSLTTLETGFQEFGPWMANGFIFKEKFLGKFSTDDHFIVNAYDENEKNPLIKIAAPKADGSETRFFVFTSKEIIEFSLDYNKQISLLEYFENSVLAPMIFDPFPPNRLNLANANNEPQLLEVLEAFEHSKYQTLLTYYIKEAKKSQELKDHEWQTFLKSNLLQTKRALFEDLDREGLTKNIENSFDEIIEGLQI